MSQRHLGAHHQLRKPLYPVPPPFGRLEDFLAGGDVITAPSRDIQVTPGFFPRTPGLIRDGTLRLDRQQRIGREQLEEAPPLAGARLRLVHVTRRGPEWQDDHPVLLCTGTLRGEVEAA